MNNQLIDVLNIFQVARTYLIQRTCNENPELFTKFYQFENNANLLNLAFEQEFILWINHHFELAKSQDLLDNSIFLQAMMQLMNTKEGTSMKSSVDEMSLVTIDILQQKKDILQSIIDIDIKSEKNYQRLLYSFEKDKVLFQRTFNQLLDEKQNGNIK